MKNYIQNMWSNKLLPGITNLTFANGEVLIFRSYNVFTEDQRNLYCFPLCDTTVKSLEKHNDDILTEIEPYYDYKLAYNGGYLIPGEGSMGNEGFVCFVDKNNKLIWSYFFDFSNPIVKIKIEDNILKCFSDNDIAIFINLYCLSLVNIYYGYLHPYKESRKLQTIRKE